MSFFWEIEHFLQLEVPWNVFIVKFLSIVQTQKQDRLMDSKPTKPLSFRIDTS